MMINRCVPGKYALYEVKPKVESNRILFPASTNVEYVEEDGRSFGYPVDYGWVTNIEYDFTVGALTEDTIALHSSTKAPQAPSQGIYPIESYDFSEDERNAWLEGLDRSWIEEEYLTYLDKGLISADESKECFTQDRLENYHLWPTEWKAVYEEAWRNLNMPKGEKSQILVNGALTLYSDENGDYFFSTKYHDHGKITKADKESAQEYIEDFSVYQEAFLEYKRKCKTIKTNLELLKSTIEKG